MKKYKTIVKSWLCGCGFLMVVPTLFAQPQSGSGTKGNVFVHSGGEVKLFGEQSFGRSPGGVIPGIVGTERVQSSGKPLATVSFQDTIYYGAGDNAHIDGYVKKYGAKTLVFPVGDNGKFAPFAAEADGTTGAYFAVDPSSGITSDIRTAASYAVPLPAGGPFPIANKDSTLAQVSNVEYWDINGLNPTRITLTWRAESDIGTLASGKLSDLTVVGWDATDHRWEVIPSAFDTTSILGGGSTLTSGSITTINPIVPDNYQVLSLARKAGLEFYLDLTVHLEGAMLVRPGGVAGEMRNDLQVFGLLPVNDPYGGSSSYSDIGNPAGLAGSVVDWVQVHIYTYAPGATTGAQVESKSLLLKTNGKIVTPMGTVPTFWETNDSVRVVIDHRNHLPVSSHKLKPFSFGSTITYDFSSTKDMAHSSSFNLHPMRDDGLGGKVDGKYCLWAGDNYKDAILLNSVDASDRGPFFADFKLGLSFIYDASDLNLDGFVDSTDVGIHAANYKRSVFSFIE